MSPKILLTAGLAFVAASHVAPAQAESLAFLTQVSAAAPFSPKSADSAPAPVQTPKAASLSQDLTGDSSLLFEQGSLESLVVNLAKLPKRQQFLCPFSKN